MPNKENVNKNLKKYIDMINVDEFRYPQDIALKIFSTLHTYEKEYRQALENGGLNQNDLPRLWEVMFAIKDKIAQMALENNDILFNGGKYSDFIKEYLNDPVNALLKQQDFMVEDYENRNKPFYAGLYSKDFNIDDATLDADLLKTRVEATKSSYYSYAEGKKDIWKEDQKLNVDWFKVYFENDSKNVDEILEDHKGGFFENLFGTTSEEYKLFAKSFKDYLSDTPDKGNYRLLRDRALNYLEHKLPSFKRYEESFNIDDYAKLDSTGKGRVKLCLDTLKAIDLACDAMDNELKLEDHAKNNIIDLQANFQNQIQDEVKMPDELNQAVIADEANDLENNNIIKEQVDEIEQ